MDIYDQGTDKEEKERASCIAANSRNSDRLIDGCCNFCHVPLGVGLRFCDNDCRDDFELERSRRRVNGR